MICDTVSTSIIKYKTIRTNTACSNIKEYFQITKINLLKLYISIFLKISVMQFNHLNSWEGEPIFMKQKCNLKFRFVPLNMVMYDSIFISFHNDSILVELIFVIPHSSHNRDKTGIVHSCLHIIYKRISG